MNLNRKKYFLCFACVLACLVYSDKVSAQFYSVRTNLVGLGTGNLNVEGSMAFSTHWSAHLPVQYNPFRLWDDGKLKKLHSPAWCALLDARNLRKGLFYRAPRCVLHI